MVRSRYIPKLLPVMVSEKSRRWRRQAIVGWRVFMAALGVYIAGVLTYIARHML